VCHIHPDQSLKRKTVLQAIFELGWKIGVFPKMLITPVLGVENDQSITQDYAYYIPHCVEISPEIKNKEYFREGSINVLTIGKYSMPRKNLLLMVKALEQLRHKYKITLTIIGSYKEGDKESDQGFQQLNDFINNHSLQESVNLKLNMPFAQVIDEYLYYDLYVFPSSNEPNGVSHLEAMACGLPAICSDSNGTRNYLEEGKNGYVFKSDNLENLTEKIELVIKDRAKIVKFGKRSLELIRKYYLPEVVGEKFIKVLKSEFNT